MYVVKKKYNKIKRCYYGVKGIGIKNFVSYMCNKSKTQDNNRYMKWREERVLEQDELDRQRKTEFEKTPLISILVPVYNTNPQFFEEMIDSVCMQTYKKWELCIANASPENQVLLNILKKKSDSRIKVVNVENMGIAQNTNAALNIAQGEYIGLLDHDDTLAENALYEIVKLINSGNVDVVYTDEDKMSWDGTEYFEPHFKSNMNQTLLYSNNYICHFFVVKAVIAKTINGFREEYNGAQDYDFILRCIDNAEDVSHIAKILYHWRSHKDSTAENPKSKQYAYEAGKKAITDSLKKKGEDVVVEDTENPGFYHVKYKLKRKDKVTIIIIYKNKEQEKKQIKKCVKAIKKTAGYSNYQITFVQKEAKITKEEIKGKYVIVVDDTIEVTKNEWMAEMVAVIQQKQVGAVGGKIYKRNETIYHAGIILGREKYAFEDHPRWEYGAFHRESLMQEVSAVSSDFMAISVEDFFEITGGDLQKLDDEKGIGQALYNCGKKVIYNPYVEAYTEKKSSQVKMSNVVDRFYGKLEN